jgi:endonuclease/exonuclease/phosphatase family metal-dependent hydrolase
VARVAAPGHQPVVVASVHLSLDAAERERHAGEVLRTLAGGGPVVLAGDLNEGDTGAAWRLIADPLRLVSPTTPTFPARAPRRLLDVVFASPGLRVLPHAPVDLDDADLVTASDHRPVWVDLDLAPVVAPTARTETAAPVPAADVVQRAEQTAPEA